MAYTVDLTDVAADIATFSESMSEQWRTCLAVIAEDPFPRSSFHLTKLVPIKEYPADTWLYDIEEEVSISQERLFVFSSEMFPFYSIVYTIREETEEVAVIYLRENRRY